MRYTSKKLIALWVIALTLIALKITNVYAVSWWWIIGLIVFSFTTFTVGRMKI